MKIAIYVFIGVLAAIIVAYLLSELLAYIRRANRAIKNTKLTPYKSYNYGTYRPYSSFNSDRVHFDWIENKLNTLDEKITTMLEDYEEIMMNKERPTDE